jgi:hypothetical protein
VILYRHNDNRFPFLWEDAAQPSARWHRDGEGPAQYFADTPGGAWAEFLRHEEITDEADLAGVARALWAVDVGEPDTVEPDVPEIVTRGGPDTYAACQAEAARLRRAGATALRTKSAALRDGGAAGWRVDLGLRAGPPAEGMTYVIFGARPGVVGWRVVDRGCPPVEVLGTVRHVSSTDA